MASKTIKDKEVTVNDVVAAIHQAATDAMDVPYGGEETGALGREEGHKINDTRVVDGFKVSINGNILGVTYNRMTTLEKAHDPNFEQELEMQVDQLKDYLKKQFKGKVGKTLELTEVGEFDAIYEYMSRVKSIVIAKKYYKIGNIPDNDNGGEDREEVYNKIDSMLEEGYDPTLAWKKYTEQE